MERSYVWAAMDCRLLRRIATISCVMSVHLSVSQSASNNSIPTGRIFMKFHICVLFEDLLRKFKLRYNLTMKTSTLHEDIFTFIISR